MISASAVTPDLLTASAARGRAVSGVSITLGNRLNPLRARHVLGVLAVLSGRMLH
jgi:hypothetical protein